MIHRRVEGPAIDAGRVRAMRRVDRSAISATVGPEGTPMTAAPSGSDPGLDLVRHLITVADCDTVYRDLYLGRAGALLAPTLSRQ